MEGGQRTTSSLIADSNVSQNGETFVLPASAIRNKKVSNKVQTSTKLLLDREERLIADLLTRFKNLVSLAAAPADEGATKEVAASQALQMEVESAALVRAVENLHQLTRELKEMWLAGPLRGIGEGEGEGTIDEDAKRVGEMVEGLLEKVNKTTVA